MVYYCKRKTIKKWSWGPLRANLTVLPNIMFIPFQFSIVQSLSRVQYFATPWTAAHQASLSITNSQSLPKLVSTKSVMLSNHLILCHPLLLLPSVFPSIMVFSNESALRIRWPKYWNFSFNISPSSKYSGLISEAVHSNKEIHEDYVPSKRTECWISMSVKHSPRSRG